jgi:class 3 adenylate cyclase
MEVSKILDEAGADAKKELTTPVTIEEVDEFPAVDELYVEKRIWKKIDDVVVVSADLKGSTKLNFRKYAQTSAQLYAAVTGNMVRLASAFQPEFIDVQGDGIFALYHGDGRYRRALCAAITIKSFSEHHLEPAIEASMSERFPETGLKVGMAGGILAVKKVGIRGTNEPVWAGKPVNWATKCAAAADRSQLIVTRRVFQKFEDNDYVTHSCGCGHDSITGENVPGGAVPSELWTSTDVETLPEDEIECKLLRSSWCPIHGDEFCTAILEGKTSRKDVEKSPLAA